MLNENIKNLRKNKGYTQEELANKLNVVRQTISKWEKGYSVPDAELLKKLAEMLDTDVSQLLGSTIEQDANVDVIAEQLARINEQLVTKNRRSRRIWCKRQVLSSKKWQLSTSIFWQLSTSILYTPTDCSVGIFY